MKITFAAEYINKKQGKGGAQRVILELANELSERGHEVTIFCTDVNHRDEFMYPVLPQVQYCNVLEVSSATFIDKAKIKFVKIFMDWKLELYKAVKQSLTLLADNKKPSKLQQYISRWNWILDQVLYNYVLNSSNLLKQSIKQNNPDVFIPCGELHFFLNPLSRLFTEKDFSIIYSVHSSVSVYFERHSITSDKLVKFNRILELADAIIVLLPEYIDALPNPLKNKASSISNPIDQADKHKRADPELNTELKTILSVGRLVPEKNHAVLLEAFANLSPRHPGWQVRIFGDGELKKELTDQIRKLKLTDKAFLMGVTDAINEEYHKAHILAMPSKFEGFPNVLGEAMAHGLPAVGFDNASGVNFLIQHEQNRLLADGESPVDGLTLCLEQLMTNPKLRAELGKNGIETAKLYNPKKIYDLWEKTIFEVKHNFNKTNQSL